MKKTCLVMLCALLLSLAPSTFASDGPAFGFFDGFWARLLAFVSQEGYSPAFPPGGQPTVDGYGPEYPTTGLTSADEIGLQDPPGGQPAAVPLPPNSQIDTGGDSEYGPEYPPHG